MDRLTSGSFQQNASLCFHSAFASRRWSSHVSKRSVMSKIGITLPRSELISRSGFPLWLPVSLPVEELRRLMRGPRAALLLNAPQSSPCGCNCGHHSLACNNVRLRSSALSVRSPSMPVFPAHKQSAQPPPIVPGSPQLQAAEGFQRPGQKGTDPAQPVVAPV